MRRLLPLAALAFALPAAAQPAPQLTPFCGGRVVLDSVETKSPVGPQGNWEYFATFTNATPQPLTITLAIAGDMGQRANGPHALRPGLNRPILLGVKPGGGFGPPLRGVALAQVIRVSCQ